MVGLSGDRVTLRLSMPVCPYGTVADTPRTPTRAPYPARWRWPGLYVLRVISA